jgi:hypothetical protein
VMYCTWHMQTAPSTRHPCRRTLGAKGGSEAETARAHGEVADQIPDQAQQLEDGGYQGEDLAPELHVNG